MFVVFEGVDGSGKTTVSGLVASELRSRGISVEHVREGGEYSSEVATRIRGLGKDTRNMALQPMAELLLYVARDAQLVAECIQPALARSRLVFADRYFYSHEVLGHYGRGLEVESIRPILDAVSGGLWPELVVLLDVDPHIARARRRVRKIERKVDGVEPGGGSRKGLGGVGMQHRLRAGYLDVAARDPKRWLVVDNCNSDLGEVVQQVSDAIQRLVEGAAPAEVVSSTMIATRAAASADVPTVEAAREAFYREVELRARVEPPVAAYFLAGLADQGAHAYRDELARSVPHVVAMGLRGLGDEHSWMLRERLIECSPAFVARSLDGEAVEGDRAFVMRERLVSREAAAVLSTLGRLDSDRAWALRESCLATEPAAVVASLKYLDDERAWTLRESFAGQRAIKNMELAAIEALLEGVRGSADPRAWSWRERWLTTAPVKTLESLAGLDDEQSWQLRTDFVAQAPKIVLRTIDGFTSDRAWALRRVHAGRVKEAIDSMIGLDGDKAWEIRDTLLDVWPSTVIKSLGALASTARGMALVERALANHQSNLSLLKHATHIAATAATAGASRRKSG